MNNVAINQLFEQQSNTIEEGDIVNPHLIGISLKQSQSQTLRHCVKRSIAEYFENLDGQNVSDLYQMVLTEVEIPLFEKVLENTRGNQTKAAEMLGLNRGTLRKKLKQYKLI